MVKKLFKHEFLFYARIMSIVYLLLFTVAGANRIIQCFENDGVTYDIVFNISCTTYGICVVAALGFGFVLSIVRFYKNLFTAEGYLTLTLPVTPGQHILVKAVTAVCVLLVSMLMVLLSFCIITAGQMLVEIWKAAAYLFGNLYDHIGAHSLAFGGELLLLFVLSLCASIMLHYTFLSIGQLFKKNRILAAVGAYFVFYIASQVVATVLIVIFSLLLASGALDSFGFWLVDMIEQHPYRVVHCSLWLGMLLPAIGILVEFLIMRRILTRKLNLE